jgi:hypothetical protein
VDSHLRKLFKSRVISALGADTVSYLIGLTNPPVGLLFYTTFYTAARTIQSEREQRSPQNYTDWKLEDWMNRYSGINASELVFLADDCGNKLYIPQVFTFDNTKKCLGTDSFKIVLRKDMFSIPISVESLTKDAFNKLDGYLGKRSFEKDNVRLAQCTIKDDRVELVLQPVNYKDYVATNLVLDYSDGERPSLRDYIHKQNTLEDLSISPLGNNLGINFLIITADNYLIIQKRSQDVAFRAAEYCPSSSGTVSLSDVLGSGTLSQCYIVQESKNELDIPVDSLCDIDLLGITRELIRGGEPELFFLASCKLKFETILTLSQKAKEKYEHSDLIKCYFGISRKEQVINIETYNCFYKSLVSAVQKCGDKSSIPLVTALALWQMQMRARVP